MIFIPVGKSVLVKPDLAPDQQKGIIIPEISKNRPESGVVVALGTGKTSLDGTPEPWEVAVGDRVLFSRFDGRDLKEDGMPGYRVLAEAELLATESPDG